MKKEFGMLFLVLLTVSVASAAIEYGEVIAKIDQEHTLTLMALDPSTEERIQVLSVTDYGTGVASSMMELAQQEVKLRFFLLDKETKEELRMFTEGPFSTTEDIIVDLREGTFEFIELEEEKEQATAKEVEENINDAITGEQKEGTDIIGITGNAAGDGSSGRGAFSTGGLFIILLGLVAFVVMHIRNKQMMATMPEERELEAIRKETKTKKKALTKMKTEERLKEKIRTEKRREARKLAKEEAELAEINKEGASERARDAERFDKRTGSSNKGGAMY